MCDRDRGGENKILIISGPMVWPMYRLCEAAVSNFWKISIPYKFYVTFPGMSENSSRC